ncbi:hypothetical protein QQ045_000334 [Rhodiola kirilowii]
MDPPPPPATNPIPAAVLHASYTESIESSPRSRTTEDDRESLTAAPGGGGGKLRLMCSYGGHIIPRPHDKSLCYVGGDTRMVVVDRNSSLGELKARLSKTLLNNRAFTLKYQLPNEDLDSLISVTTDEDLENMIDEFDRICKSSSGAKSSRLRVFLFVNKHESGSSIESILDSSVKSEDWFYNALNGSGASARGFTDVNSVNSLLGLENDSVVINNGGNLRSGNSRELEALQADMSKKNQKSSNQDAQLNPDSLMIETSSSFGSTSSSPSLANLRPIRVRVEGGGVNKIQDQRGAVEGQFAQMNVSAGGKQEEGFAAMASPPQILNTFVPATVVPGVPVIPDISRGELPERIVSDDERSDQGAPVGFVRSQTQPQAQSQQQQKPSGIFGIASPDSASSEGSILYQDPFAQIPPGAARVTSNPMDSNNPRIPLQQKVPESGYILNSQIEHHQLQQQLQQQQQLQPQQFVHPGTHYIQHPQNAVPISQYYHLYPPPTQHRHPQHDQQQYPLYFIPPTAIQSQQTYSMPMQQASYSDPSIAVPSSHPQNPHMATMLTNPSVYNSQPGNVSPVSPEMASNGYRNVIPNAQPMVQVAPGQHQQQYMGYSQVQHSPQSMAQPQIPASATNANFTYEYSDPAHTQIYYTQPLAPTHPAQYQTTVSSSPMVMLPDAASAQNLNDTMKQQIRTSQAQ